MKDPWLLGEFADCACVGHTHQVGCGCGCDGQPVPRPPLEIPRWMIHEFWAGITPLPPKGYKWEEEFTRDVLVAVPDPEYVPS